MMLLLLLLLMLMLLLLMVDVVVAFVAVIHFYFPTTIDDKAVFIHPSTTIINACVRVCVSLPYLLYIYIFIYKSLSECACARVAALYHRMECPFLSDMEYFA